MTSKNTKDATRYVRGGGTVRQRPDGRWEARCTFNGKRRSFYGSKQADVLKAMRDAQMEAESGSYVEPSKMTFGEWIDVWYNEYNKPTLKKTSQRTRESYLKHYILPTLGAVRLQEIDALTIQRFYNSCTKTLSAYTIKTGIHSVISSALKQAVKCGYIESNPTTLCEAPRRVKREFPPFTEKEVATFLRLLEEEEPTTRCLFAVILFTGMRFGEALGLTWSAVDFEKKTITIKQQLQGSLSALYLSTPKNGKPRVIYPSQIVFDLLKAEALHQEECRKLAGELYGNPWDLVFTNPLGEACHRYAARYRFKSITKKMGRPDMRVHDLRHTYAVMALTAGVDPKTVQSTLGHHSAQFTLDVYAHITEDMTRRSAERMQAFYENLQTMEEI